MSHLIAETMIHSPLPLLSLALLAASAVPVRAQCPTAWDLPTGLSVAGSVQAMLDWDPDGPGPLPVQFVVAGAFASAGGIPARNVAMYDPASGVWSTLGSGVAGVIRALAVLPTGELVVAGSLTEAGAIPVANIARWDGVTWQALSGGVNGSVESLAVSGAGTLFVGGLFTHAGGAPAANVANWNGSVWTSLGAGLAGAPPGFSSPGVRALAVLPNGDLCAVGGFSSSGAVPVDRIARWDGATWHASGLPLFILTTLTTVVPAANGVLVAGTNPDFVTHWDGTSWTPLGSAPSSPGVVRELGNGDVVIAGGFSLFGAVASRYRAGVWTVLGTGPGPSGIHALSQLPGSQPEEFVAGGAFASFGGVGAASLARWTGQTWVGVAPVVASAATAVAVGADGRIVLGGDFLSAFGVPANRIVAWDGTAWQALGSGLPQRPTGLVVRDNGDVLAASSGVPVQRWDGVAWSSMPTAPGASSFVTSRDGRLALLGSTLSIENGSGWTNTNAQVLAAAFAPDGSLVAGGLSTAFPGVNGRVARWVGGSWQSLDPTYAMNGVVEAVAVLPGGEVFAGGGFSVPGLGIVRLVGGAWQQVGAGLNGTVRDLRVLPTGELLAVGTFTASGPVALPGMALWDGVGWAPVSGVASTLPPTNGVADVAVHPRGDLLLAGGFLSPSANFGWLRSSCPAAAVPLAPGCTGGVTGGHLVALAWPLLGGEFVARASQMPASSLAVAVTSELATNLPLTALLPQGDPACSLLVDPELIQLVPVQGGSGSVTWSLPVVPSLLGVSFRHQWLVFELGGTTGITSVTATRALQVVVGSLQ